MIFRLTNLCSCCIIEILAAEERKRPAKIKTPHPISWSGGERSSLLSEKLCKSLFPLLAHRLSRFFHWLNLCHKTLATRKAHLIPRSSYTACKFVQHSSHNFLPLFSCFLCIYCITWGLICQPPFFRFLFRVSQSIFQEYSHLR